MTGIIIGCLIFGVITGIGMAIGTQEEGGDVADVVIGFLEGLVLGAFATGLLVAAIAAIVLFIAGIVDLVS